MVMVGLVLMLVSGKALAKTIIVTTEVDKPVLLAGQQQNVFLRVGLTGCEPMMLDKRPPVNVAIVIDKSGSMSGEKIEKAKESAILALHRLKANDIASVVVYDSGVEVLVPATKMTSREDMIRKIRRISAGGSTALHAGVQTGAKEVRKFRSNRHVNRIVLLSDGLANVGPDSPKALGDLGACLVDEGISVTTIGLGLGYNEDLMSQLAFRSDGGHYFAEDADELAGIFDQEFGKSLSVVAQDVHIEIICGEGMRPIRILGREGKIKGRTVTMDIQNIYSQHEKYAIIEVEVPEHAKGKRREIATAKLSYQNMHDNKKDNGLKTLDITFSDSQSKVDSQLNKQVLADAVEQIAIVNNERALALRDAGKTEQAKEALMMNSGYLRSNAQKLGSSKLDSYATENEYDAQGLEDKDWGRQRKSMRESQTSRRSQR
jgi:Ca-activated chloride channel family protein